MAKLLDQLNEALRASEVCAQPPALIGGLAVNAHRVVRATSDVDLLVDAVDAERLHDAFRNLGYSCLYRTEEVANYSRDDERLDVIYAHRERALQLLRAAKLHVFAAGSLRVHVVSVEGLIGFKIQAFRNDPRRNKDLDDIRELLRINGTGLNMHEVREYFELFEATELLQQLLEELRPSEELRPEDF